MSILPSSSEQDYKYPLCALPQNTEKNDMSDAEYKIKLRQQFWANIDTFVDKEIEKEKSKREKRQLNIF